MDWSEGYVDVGYTHGFYRELNPALHRFALLAGGVDAGPAAGERFAYCELGCGQGFSAALLAASHPDSEFHANDFLPGHIASARRIAAETGTANVFFYDDSFEDFARRDLPAFDIIALHGVYSWISDESRRHVVDFIARRLKVGGIVYISYNCQPGWAAAMPMRELMHEFAGNPEDPVLPRIDAALTKLQALFDARASYTVLNPELKGRFDGIKAQPRTYVAHEFFNRSWRVFYHTEIARDLKQAKLDFGATVNLLEQVDSIMMTADQQKLLNDTPAGSKRELIRDHIINQQFRRDLFVKGGLPISPRRREALLTEMRFVLTEMPDAIPRRVLTPLGSVALNAAVFEPVIAALSVGARSIGDLLQDETTRGLGFPLLLEAILILAGANHLQPCLDAAGDDRRREHTERFNRAVLERVKDSSELSFVASPLTGGGIFLTRFAQLFLLAMKRQEPDEAAFVWRVLAERNEAMLRDGQLLQTEAENLARVRELHADFKSRLPLLQRLGIA
jgi:SAM-dependent methyltransferase